MSESWIDGKAPGILALGPDIVAQGYERARALQVRSVKRDILAALVGTGIGPQAAVQVLDAMCNGEVPHVSVHYINLRAPWRP